MIWRCPWCGHQDIEVNGIQSWSVEMSVVDSEVERSETVDPVQDLTITQVLCLHCNAEDTSDKYWHMTRREWERELKARAADAYYDLKKDK